jgi:hypothetical protein
VDWIHLAQWRARLNEVVNLLSSIIRRLRTYYFLKNVYLLHAIHLVVYVVISSL